MKKKIEGYSFFTYVSSSIFKHLSQSSVPCSITSFWHTLHLLTNSLNAFTSQYTINKKLIKHLDSNNSFSPKNKVPHHEGVPRGLTTIMEGQHV